MMFQLLKLYPLVPAAYHKASLKDGLDQLAPTEELLRDSMTETHAANRRRIERLLEARGRFKREGKGYRFSLQRGELEWLLQVFNDIRVGCWLRLGSPDEKKMRVQDVTSETLPLWATMRACELFQWVFLHSLDGNRSH
jgi:hypothetical protein